MKGMYGEEQSATQQAFGDALDLLLGDDIQKIEKGRPGPANGGAPAGGRVRFTPGGPIGPPVCAPGECLVPPVAPPFCPPTPVIEPNPKTVPRIPGTASY